MTNSIVVPKGGGQTAIPLIDGGVLPSFQYCMAEKPGIKGAPWVAISCDFYSFSVAFVLSRMCVILDQRCSYHQRSSVCVCVLAKWIEVNLDQDDPN